MSKVYFAKELVNNNVLIGGAPVQWEVLDGNRGVIALDEAASPTIIAGLNAFASKHICGVVRITEADYTEKKSLHPWTPSAQKPKEMLQAVPAHADMFRVHKQVGLASPVEANPSGPAPATAPPPAASLPPPTPATPPAAPSDPAANKTNFRPAVARASSRGRKGNATPDPVASAIADLVK